MPVPHKMLVATKSFSFSRLFLRIAIAFFFLPHPHNEPHKRLPAKRSVDGSPELMRLLGMFMRQNYLRREKHLLIVFPRLDRESVLLQLIRQ